MSIDRRTLYTRRVIKEALSLLLNKSSLDRITVKEICVEADINRATFYRHYKDIYDLFEQMEIDIIEEVYVDDALPFISPELLKIIYNNQGFYRQFFKTHMGSPYIKKIVKRMYDEIYKRTVLKEGVSEGELRYVHDYYIHGVTGLLRDWVESGCTSSADELYRVISDITKNEFERFYKKD